MEESGTTSANRFAVRGVSMRGVRVPLTFTLGTAVASVAKVPLLLIDLETSDGLVGRSYLFCYTASGARAIAEHIGEAVDLIAGQPLTPAEAGDLLEKRFALLGVTGTVRMALSAIDVALWDALGQRLNLPIASLLGGAPRPLPAYDSRGLGLMPTAKLADEAAKLIESGLGAVKLRLGYPTLGEDLAALEAVRRAVGTDVGIMVDYNQSLASVAEALHRGRAMEEAGLVWIEEPIRHDDYEGYAAISLALKTPLQFGENMNGPTALMTAAKASASDYVMIDVARIGGVTGWRKAAAIASAAGIELSSHLMPEISAQLLCASGSAHWLEWVDWGAAILQEPMRLSGGTAISSSLPGAGFLWDEARLRRLETL
jgi:mandelate racemase